MVNSTAEACPTAEDVAEKQADSVNLVVVHNRTKYPVNLPPTATVLDVKQLLASKTQIPVEMQKLFYRGNLSDASQLQQLQLPTKGAKLMLVGTTPSETENMRRLETQSLQAGDGTVLKGDDEEVRQSGDEVVWGTQTEHRQVLDRHGKPDNAGVAFTNGDDVLAPDVPLAGLCDKRGQGLRLRIRPDTSELWLATHDVTHKFPLATIHNVLNQPIPEHPEYHIMAFQLGPTPKSRFFVYWVPAQYVNSIKTMVLQYKIAQSSGYPSF